MHVYLLNCNFLSHICIFISHNCNFRTHNGDYSYDCDILWLFLTIVTLFLTIGTLTIATIFWKLWLQLFFSQNCNLFLTIAKIITKITLLLIRSLSCHFDYIWLLQKAQNLTACHADRVHDVIKEITLMPSIVRSNYIWFCLCAVVKLKWTKKALYNFHSQQQQPPYKLNQSSYLFFLIRPARARREMDVYIKCSGSLG